MAGLIENARIAAINTAKALLQIVKGDKEHRSNREYVIDSLAREKASVGYEVSTGNNREVSDPRNEGNNRYINELIEQRDGGPSSKTKAIRVVLRMPNGSIKVFEPGPVYHAKQEAKTLHGQRERGRKLQNLIQKTASLTNTGIQSTAAGLARITQHGITD